jgi:opacity protein-like surface antigen
VKKRLVVFVLLSTVLWATGETTGRLPVGVIAAKPSDPSAPSSVTQELLPQSMEGIPQGVISRARVVNKTRYIPVETYPEPSSLSSPDPVTSPAPGPESAPAPAPAPRFVTAVQPRGEAATGWNASVYAGANFAQSAQIRTTLFNTASVKYKESSKTGINLGAKLGYTFPFENFSFNQRLSGFQFTPGVEAEVSYLKSDLKGRLTDADVGGFTGVSPTLLSSLTPLNAGLKIDSAVFMMNWLGKMQIGSSFRPYIGAGVGMAYTHFESADLARIGTQLGTAGGVSVSPQHSSSSYVLAYQVLAGGEYFVARDWSLFGEYKYVVLDSFSTLSFPVDTKVGSLGNHVGVVGVRTYF